MTLMGVIAFTVYSVVTSGGYLDVADLDGVDRACTVTVAGVIVGYDARPEDGVLYVTLASKKEARTTVLVEFNYNQFVMMHKQAPGPWIIGREIVVKGLFDPQARVIVVREIMVPCHEGYGSPPAR